MPKRKEAAVFKAFNDYIDRDSDLKNNPKYKKLDR
jgi:4-hydroxybenzoate polyprenyltransferase